MIIIIVLSYSPFFSYYLLSVLLSRLCFILNLCCLVDIKMIHNMYFYIFIFLFSEIEMNSAVRDFAEKLVLEVQKRELLYNTRHPDYKDRIRAEQEWQAVAEVLGSTGGCC